ncbi:PHP domain protein [Marinomonas spartinae]|uniref:PHP domain protein n=1 Tax=Marinomonas spartinae TaxID=1792290 RepID=A0A1A8TS26_9GAMM|nr:CehA/McbA family metallohydrolase [Marinomonas spartinae]SBS36088.1 PHP domain protein [Marinomonas spartinae]
MLQFSDDVSFGRHTQTFTVADPISTLTIEGSTVKRGFLYLLVIDPNGALRANILLEKRRKRLAMSEAQASVGAIKGELPTGTWRLEFVNVEGEFRQLKPMQYSLDITFDRPIDNAFVGVESLKGDQHIHFDMQRSLSSESRWYRGDLHAHTNLSDGQNPLEDVLPIAKSQKLDVLFITEHNMCHGQLPEDPDCLILPAMEVTTDLGHCNIHGPARTLNMLGSDITSQTLLDQAIAIKEQRGNLSINHPMMLPWHWHYDRLPLRAITSLEICCDPTWSTSPQATEKALALLTLLWNAGHRVTAVGGSDSHLTPEQRNPKATEPSIYGDPSTYVWANTLNGEAILSGIQAGHVYFERTCKLHVAINQGNVLPGDDVGDGTVTWQISVDNQDHEFYGQWIADGDLIAEHDLTNEAQNIQVSMEDYAWVRVDIRRRNREKHDGQGDIDGVINAVYNGNRPCFHQPTASYWSDLNLANTISLF